MPLSEEESKKEESKELVGESKETVKESKPETSAFLEDKENCSDGIASEQPASSTNGLEVN